MRIGERSFLKKREERWSKNFDAFHPVVVTLAQEEKRESALVFRLAIAGAVILHLVLVVITFPVFDHTPMESKSSQRVYRVRQVRFVPPPQQQIKRSAPRPKARRLHPHLPLGIVERRGPVEIDPDNG